MGTNHFKKKRILPVVFIFSVTILILSCDKENYGKIPFGYDPSFNYLAVLKSSPGYAYESTEGYPEFTYQEPNNKNLTELRTIYNLDSIAGTGDELDRILNLFHWVHKTINHD